MIVKSVTVTLTHEEVSGPEPIEIKLTVMEAGTDDQITYTIEYPKEQ